jgi:tetratricopeptide (TPR) repeat protein
MLDRLRSLLRPAPETPASNEASHPDPDPAAVVRGAMEHASAGRYAEAEHLVRSHLAADPGNAALLFALGRIEFMQGGYAAATDSFQASLAGERDPFRRERTRLHHAQAAARRDLARGARPADHRRSATAAPPVSVVIPSITPEKFARAADNFRRALADVDHEIIGIHDARSMCEACNRGARQGRGEVVVFAHDDVELVAPDFAARLLDRLETFDVVGVAGTSRLVGPAWVAAGPPHVHGQVGYRAAGDRIEVVAFGLAAAVRGGIQALDGCFMAARREVLAEVPFDEQSFPGWHLYDVDFSLSAWLAGFGVAVCADLLLIHQSRGRYDAQWQHAANAFVAKHRAVLPAATGLEPVRVQGIVVEGVDEWRLVTERLTAAGGER